MLENNSSSQPRVVWPSRGQLAMSGAILGRHIWGWGEAVGIREARMLLNTLQCVGQRPTTENNFTPNASSAEVEISPDIQQALQILSAYGNDFPRTDTRYSFLNTAVKLTTNYWFKTTHVYYFTIREVRSLRRESISLPFPAPRGSCSLQLTAPASVFEPAARHLCTSFLSLTNLPLPLTSCLPDDDIGPTP